MDHHLGMRMPSVGMDADVIVVGAGLAGLVATAELADAGKRVLLLDQEPEQSPRRPGVLVVRRAVPGRHPRAAPACGIQRLPRAGLAGLARHRRLRPRRRTTGRASGPRPTSTSPPARSGPGCTRRACGSSRWSAGPSAAATRADRPRQLGAALPHHLGHRARAWSSRSSAGSRDAAADAAWSTLRFRHRVDDLVSHRRRGHRRARRGARAQRRRARRRPSSRAEVGDFELRAQAVVVTSGGIGGNHDLVRASWPARLGAAAAADALRRARARRRPDAAASPRPPAASVINRDRMWHYTEGIAQLGPDLGRATASGSCPARRRCGSTRPASGCRCRCSPASTPSARCAHIVHDRLRAHLVRAHPEDHREGVRALRLRAEPRPDRQGHAPGAASRVAARRAGAGARRSRTTARTSSSPTTLRRAGRRDEPAHRRRPLARPGRASSGEVVARDREIANPFTKDLQITAIRGARSYRGDKLIRVATPHRLLDPEAGPLIAVRLNILTRKTLGGLETDLAARVLRAGGEPLPGLYAAGEVAGFGGGGMHGYRSLEGTFLGGCLFSGRTAGRAAAAALG